jgi:hypothetical protein
MASHNRIKVCHENKLQLRPFWLGDFSSIRKLHTAIKKNKENSILLSVLVNGTEKLLKVFSPITNSLLGLKNILKKHVFKTYSSARMLEEPNEVFGGKRKTRRYKYHRKNRGKKSKEIFIETQEEEGVNTGEGIDSEVTESDIPETPPPRRYNTRQSKYLSKECQSCDEDYAACKTCSSCLSRDPNLPSSSCAKCQKKGPVVNLCSKFHNKRPVVHLPDSAANEDLYDKFQQRRELLKEVSKFCKGDSPKINHCPMCSTIQPQIGECSCKNCKQIQPIIKIAKWNKNTIVEMCPCQNCSRLRPKVKVCEDCKSTQINRAKSYYVILSSK